MHKTPIKSVFSVMHPEDGIVAVFDNMHEDPKAMSVTNDANNVVAALTETGDLKPGVRLIYQDTESRWDEMRHDGKGAFLGFRSLDAKSLDMAIECVRSKELPLHIAKVRPQGETRTK